VRYRDAEKRGGQDHYQKIESSWDTTISGFKNAVKLYRDSGVPSADWLPYRYLLLPPAIAAAKGHVLNEKWVAWAIVASLWRHYAGEVDTKLQRDASLAEKGDIDGLIEHVKSRAKRVDSAIPEEEDFLQNIVSEGGVYLTFLVYSRKSDGRSFPGGKLLNGAEEPLEVHHIFPRAVLDKYPDRDNEYVPDRTGNLTILTRSDNEHISDSPPASYLPLCDDADRSFHLVPDNTALWQVERFREFCEERERKFANAAKDLLVTLGAK
jgi:hypothetical protein